ncbi:MULTISPECIES: oxygen-insensitive NAD(P)H nitroreductase [Gilliamella]|uniref:Oxygen-insensitive NAD(P)H nitroreductase n=1 Tax=Gilliamella apis TaxID=1970738 RepID=A0A2V4DT18_9GAMM|nr:MULTISPECIES: oxygen-insensitive NAD(P)H nitroreductase [Gilliamella]MBI0005635.1 oxygen-insensitive NAD(P)H nitroreductase [Gilliamella sp. W8126]MBI0103750.1 oxygen-insensitive NAD(P)H nitroreductase [Gilliamella sp. W8145]PXY91241.1 oxygen-insensitive NAD(P)H nitroreductase [Gilliamella apis]WLS93770.1 oxygen-insensitive NAD(P)H nitroreductase [Gilliamella apis]
MNIVEISQKRYTTKHYDKSKKIPKEKIEQLLTVLRNSPSSVNSQPWHFYIIDNDAAKNKILPAIAEFNQPRVTDSSHTILFCIKSPLEDAHLVNLLNQEEKDGRLPSSELKQTQDESRRFFVTKNSKTIESQQSWEGKQTYLALGQLLFAAAAIGVDSTAVEGFDCEKMDEILNLKQKGLKSLVIATLGYRSENDGNAHRPKSRLPEEQIFTFL